MKASELRIGNYVQNDFKKSNGFPDYFDRVTMLNHFGECGVFTCPIDKDYAGTPAMMVSGIELSEEWLEKFGFEKLIDGDGTYELPEVGGVHFPFDFRWRKNGGTKLGEMSDHCYAEWHMNHIQHVHQLQNLFHALTGEELKLTQP